MGECKLLGNEAEALQRLKEEYESLDNKYNALCCFMKRENFKKLPWYEHDLMYQQKAVMFLYLDILFKRTMEIENRLNK